MTRHRGKTHQLFWERAGFTLVELLVVIAIITLLVSILLPSLSVARQQARSVVCRANLHGIGRGLMVYTTEQKDWIPGVNTTGIALRVMKDRIASRPETLNNPRIPVQQWDWISPIILQDGGISGTRAERFRILTGKYRCPAQEGVESVLYPFGASDPVDREEFLKAGTWTALSYLMPSHFQYWGESEATRTLARTADTNQPIRPLIAPPNWEVRVKSYTSRLGSVGSPATKIAVADGTRYVTASGLIDHDVTLFPQFFGSFTCSSAWWSGSTEFGVKGGSKDWDGRSVVRASPSQGRNLSLSYRHGRPGRGAVTCDANKGAISAMFFDGHAELLSDRQSRSIDYWYPAGAVVRTPREGMTVVPEDYMVR